MAKNLMDKYYAAIKKQQLAKAALRLAEKNLREVIMWHVRNEQLYAALNSSQGDNVVILDTPRPTWGFGAYGNPTRLRVLTPAAYGDAEEPGTLWQFRCNKKDVERFLYDYPDIVYHNVSAIEAAQIQVQRCVQQYNAAIAAANAAERTLQEQR